MSLRGQITLARRVVPRGKLETNLKTKWKNPRKREGEEKSKEGANGL